MAEIVNLRRARKQKARAKATDLAQSNRLQFGLTKADRNAAKLENARALRQWQSHDTTLVKTTIDE